MTVKLDTLKGELGEQLKQATELKAAADSRGDDTFTPEETEKAQGITAEVARLKKAIADESEGLSIRKAIGDLGAALGSDEPLTEDNIPTVRVAAPRRGKSWGEQITESQQFKSLTDTNRSGRADFWNGVHVNMDPVELKSILTEGSATQGGPLVNPDQLGLGDSGGFLQRPMTLRDLITVGRTNSNSIRYARVTGFTNAATGVHEASTATGTNAAGGLKPQSDLALEEKTATVVTLAHWFAATKQALADIPQMQTLINSFGRYGLEEEEEDQIIAGTGASNDQLEGFNTVSGMQTQTFSTDIFTSIRKGMTKIRKIGRARPTGVLVNLEDDEKIDLTRIDSGGGAGTGEWLGNGPWSLGPSTLWGVPRVASEACPASKAYVADFRTIVLLIRDDPTMRMTDSHADYFVRNLVALLFEERATELIFRPKAIVEVATA